MDWSTAAPPTIPGITRVSSDYGFRELRGQTSIHSGIDIAGTDGSPVMAVLPAPRARIFPSGELSNYGNTVVLEHAPGFFSLYAHLTAIMARPGDQVAAGQLIGTMGRTAGTRTDPGRLMDSPAHLHFEILRAWPPSGIDRDRIDPVPLLRAVGIVAEHNTPILVIAGAMAAGSASELIAQRVAPIGSLVPAHTAPPRRPTRPDSNELIAQLLQQPSPTPYPSTAPGTWPAPGPAPAAGNPWPLILLFLFAMREKGR